MPVFPHSTYTSGKAVGVNIRGQGGPAPLVEFDGSLIVTDETNHPFKVILKGTSGSWTFRVVPGTVNSIVPKLDGTLIDAATPPTKSISSTGYVYLELPYSSGQVFPYLPTVKYASSVPTSDDTTAYVSVAHVVFTGTTPKVNAQNIETSLWAERLKCGSSAAVYYVSRA